MKVRRPLLIKNILVEAGLPPGLETQSFTKQQLEKILLLLIDQKNTITNLKSELSIIIQKGTEANVSGKTQESDNF